MNEHHPERQTGQRWKDKFGAVYTLVGELGAERWESRAEFNGVNYGSVPIEPFHWEHMTLLSPAPGQAAPCKAPDRTKCKAWCGGLAPGGPGYQSSDGFAYWVDSGQGDYNEAKKGPHYCRGGCRDARVPPLSATPVPGPAANDSGTAPVRIQIDPTLPPGEMRIKDGDQVVRIVNIAVIPPAQEAPKAPSRPCINAKLGGCAGSILLRWLKNWSPAICDAHYLEEEKKYAALTPSSGTPYDGPERLARPKLAHSMGVEDPALENA